MYAVGPATERLAAAAEAAHGGPDRLVLTARADNSFHGIDDLDDTIARLRAFEAAGADVLYAPAVSEGGDLQRIFDAVSVPINVLAQPVRRAWHTWPGSVSPGSRSARASTGRPSAASSPPHASFSTTAPMASGRERLPGGTSAGSPSGEQWSLAVLRRALDLVLSLTNVT